MIDNVAGENSIEIRIVMFIEKVNILKLCRREHKEVSVEICIQITFLSY